MTYRVDFKIGDRLVAEGEISSICCALGGEKLRPVPIPPFLADKIVEAPAPTRETT